MKRVISSYVFFLMLTLVSLGQSDLSYPIFFDSTMDFQFLFSEENRIKKEQRYTYERYHEIGVLPKTQELYLLLQDTIDNENKII